MNNPSNPSRGAGYGTGRPGREEDAIWDDADAPPEGQLPLAGEDERLPWLESGEEEDEGGLDLTRLITVAVVGLLVVVGLVAGLRWAMGGGPDEELLAEGSTIEAPEGPLRERPDNAGGIEVAGTGDISFAVGSGQSRESVLAQTDEGLAAAGALPVAEAGGAGVDLAGVNRAGADAGGAAAMAAGPASGAAGAAGAGSAAGPGARGASWANGAAATRGAGAAGAAGAGSAGVAAARSPAARSPAPGASAIGVQVAAFTSGARAEQGWRELVARYEPLQGRSHRVVPASVDGATVYRLQVLADSPASAQSLCASLRAAGGDCQVVR